MRSTLRSCVCTLSVALAASVMACAPDDNPRPNSEANSAQTTPDADVRDADTRDVGIDDAFIADATPADAADATDATGGDAASDALGDTADVTSDGRVAWTPDAVTSERPRLLVGPDMRPTILARIAGDGLPADVAARFAEADRRVRALCAREVPTLDPEQVNIYAMVTVADIAKSCAWLAWLEGDAAQAQRAQTILEGLPTDLSKLLDSGRAVHTSAALASTVQAWDLLDGAGLVDTSAARAVVVAMLENTTALYLDPPVQHAAWANNHNLKFYSALGLGGLAFPEHPMAERWLYLAQAETTHVLTQWQSPPNGGYSEGLYYQSYAMTQLVPYAWAWRRAVGPEAEHDWPVDCRLRILDPGGCQPGATERVGALWEHPTFRASLLRNVMQRMPDGARPPIDDGALVGLISGMLSSLDPVFGWDWLHQDLLGTWAHAGDLTVEQLAAFDGRAEPPAWDPSWTDPNLGAAVLATDHGPDATWAMLLAEPPGVTTSWHGHEHADAGSLQLFARGRYLVLDTGYMGWSQRDLTAPYAAHSGVLVDGQGWPLGPTGDPVSQGMPLGDLDVAWDLQAPAHTASVQLTSDLAQWTRSVRLDGPDVVLVRDDLTSDTDRAWQWRLHLGDGPERGQWTPTDYGGLLHTDAVTLVVVVWGRDASVTLGAEVGQDALLYGILETHTVLTADLSGAQAGFRAALVLAPPGANPTVTADAEGWTVDDRSGPWW